MDPAFAGDTSVSASAGGYSVGAGGNTHLYVGTLVLLALAGMILIHMGGFRAMTDVSVGGRR